MKYLATSLLLLVTATVAFSGIAGFLTKEIQDWKFVQSVGGMKISAQEKVLLVDCDVSGLKKVTVDPTTVNSGMGVRKLKHQRIGNIIRLSLITSVLERGMSSTCKPVDLSAYPEGTYTVQYIDPDRTIHPLGTVTLEAKKSGEQTGERQPATAPGAKSVGEQKPKPEAGGRSR